MAGPFTSHMVMHMLLVAVVAPLLALALAQSRFDPVRAAPWWFSPIPASTFELLIVWGWHAPAAHALAHHSPTAAWTEQATFLASGLWLWLSAFGGDPERRGIAGVTGLLLTSMHMTLLGALLVVAPRVLYVHSSLADQHLGGAIMLVMGGVAYMWGALYLLSRLLRPRVSP